MQKRKAEIKFAFIEGTKEMDKKLQNPVVVAILALFSCFLWGSAFPAVKTGFLWFHINGTGSQILFAGYRFFLAGIFTLLLGCILEKRFLMPKRSSGPYILGQGILQTTIQYVFYYIGMANTTGTKGAIISGSNGLIAIIAAHFILKSEKMTWRKWCGCTLGLAGIVIVNLQPGAWGSGVHLLGEGMILISAIAYGFSSITLKMISHRESPITITAYQLLVGGIVLIALGWLMGGVVTGFTIKSTALFIYMALLSTVAFSLWTLLLKYNAVGKISIYTCAIPIFGVLLSGLLLGESILEFKNLVALMLVSGGVVVINRASS